MKGSILAVLMTGFVCAACSANRPAPIHEASTLEGLERVQVRGLDAVYVKPDADLSKYRRIMVDELDVAEFQRMLSVHVTGTFLGIQRCARRWFADGTRGSFVTMSLVTNTHSVQGQPH